MTVEQLLQNAITILAVVGSALSVYLNWKKAGEKVQQDLVWKALTDKKLVDIADDIKEMRIDERANKQVLQNQEDDIHKLTARVDDHDRQFTAVWKRVDSLREREKE